MNDDRIGGEVRDIGGKLKETAGNLTGDRQLQSEGLADQVGGKVQKGVGLARDTLSGTGPIVDQVKDFARRRPFAFAAVAGVLGVALLNTLRGKR